MPLSKTPTLIVGRTGGRLNLGLLVSLASPAAEAQKETLCGCLWTRMMSPLVVRSMLNASKVLAEASDSSNYLKWAACGSITFICAYSFELCQAPADAFRYHPVMYCLWHRASGRQDDGLNPSVFFSQSVLKERNRSRKQKEGERGKITKLDFLYCALMPGCVVLFRDAVLESKITVRAQFMPFWLNNITFVC